MCTVQYCVYSCGYSSNLFVMVFHRKIHIIWQKITNALLNVLEVTI